MNCTTQLQESAGKHTLTLQENDVVEIEKLAQLKINEIVFDEKFIEFYNSHWFLHVDVLGVDDYQLHAITASPFHVKITLDLKIYEKLTKLKRSIVN